MTVNLGPEWPTPDDVIARYPYDVQVPSEWIDTIINDAATLLYAEIPRLEDRIASGKVTEAQLARVVSRMVLTVANNPQGFRTEQDGEYSYTYAAAADHGLHVTSRERRLLSGRGGAVTVGPGDDDALRALSRPVWRSQTSDDWGEAWPY